MPSVYAVTNILPEISAYATVRYSRSPDSMRESIDWIFRQSAESAAGKAGKFFEDYYFAYGHGSIADCGMITIAIEQSSQLMAEEVEDEPLWNGQEQSTRYQDFSQPRFWKPGGWTNEHLERYNATITSLFGAYHSLSQSVFNHFTTTVEKPSDMEQVPYERALHARAFDVARYLLPMATLTNVGQIISIRVLERQIRRLLASRHAEIRTVVGEELVRMCATPPYDVARERFLATMQKVRGELDVTRSDSLNYYKTKELEKFSQRVLTDVFPQTPVVPTLARHLEPDTYLEETRTHLKEIADAIIPKMEPETKRVELVEQYANPPIFDPYFIETVTTALYWVTHYSYAQLQQVVTNNLTYAQLMDVWKALFSNRRKNDELLRLFRSGYPLVFDLCVDIGAYRDLKRHRRCVQVRQDLSSIHGYEIPEILNEDALSDELVRYTTAVDQAHRAHRCFNDHYPYDALYVLPLATRRRSLFKMDPAEAVYIAELRTGVGGHFSYRSAAYEMYQALCKRYPYFQEFEDERVTHPSVQAPLKR